MFTRLLSRIAADESGATAVEYGVMLAMMILVCIAGINALGGANQAFWSSNLEALSGAIFTPGN